jgi:hypothetical protein
MADAESIQCTQLIPYTQSDLSTALADSSTLGADERFTHAQTLGYDPTTTLSDLQSVVVSTYGCLVRALPVLDAKASEFENKVDIFFSSLADTFESRFADDTYDTEWKLLRKKMLEFIKSGSLNKERFEQFASVMYTRRNRTFSFA